MDKKEQRTISIQYAAIARAYFKARHVYRYRMRKIEDMDDSEVIQKVHWWYTEHGLEDEYRRFEEEQLR